MFDAAQVVLFGVTQGCSNAQGSQGVSLKGHPKWNKNRFQQGLRARLRYDSSTESCKVSPIDVRKSSSEGVARKVNSDTKINSEECETSFASTGTTGVVDLGASQSVIGNQQIPDLLKQLPSEVRQQIRRTNCSLTFRFGNHQTLESHHALLFPLLGKWFRVAVVKGNTPFLLSSKFLKETIGAVIDTVEGTMWSKVLNRHLPIELTVKNLYLLDINHLWKPESQSKQETFHVQQVQPETSNLETALNRVRGVVKSEHSENQTIEKDNDSDKVSDKIIKDPSPNSSDHKVSQEVTSQVSSFDAESPEEEGPKALLVSESIRESPSHHVHGQDVSGSKTQGLSGQAPGCDRTRRDEAHRNHDTGRDIEGDNRLWKVQARPDLHNGLLGSGMDKLVCEPLYESSGKKAHRKYIRFVELMLETEPTLPVNKNKDKSKMKGYSAKAKAAASAPEVDQAWEQVRPVDETSESELSVDFKVSHLEEEVVYMRQESKQLNTRMIAMEGTMNEIVQHLRKMQVKTEK